MIKKTKSVLVIPVITILFTVTFSGCPNPDTDPDPVPAPAPTYTVWTETTSSSNFNSTFDIDLQDGYYVRAEIDDSAWNDMAPSLTNEGKNYWTESQLKKWFIGRGFGDAEANEATAWLVTIRHGFLASRKGEVVYMLLK
jgi:hypothetical protein